MGKFFYQLPLVFIGVAVATFLFPAAVAQSDLEGKAKKITIKLLSPSPLSKPGSNNFDMAGSGIIIAREKNTKTYYVLTAAHVIVAANQDQVVTPDKRKYPIKSIFKLRQDIDLKVLQFNSDRDYTVAEIGNSAPSQLSQGATIYIGGWSKEKPDSFTFVNGRVTNNSLGTEDNGYTLFYREAATVNGMSGGPIINDRGQLVGVHGRTGAWEQKGIPIKTFLPIAPPEIARLIQPSTTAVGVTNRPTPTPSPTSRQANTGNVQSPSSNINRETISLNQTISGSLNGNEPINSYTSGRFRDYQLVGVSPGQSIQINVDSAKFDPSLQIINATNNQVIAQNDDRRGGGRNSQLIFTVKEGIQYLIRVTTYYPNGIGNYTLRTRIK